MQIPPRQVRESMRQRHSQDADVQDTARALDRAEYLLHRSLYEFGSELRTEIERFLGESPLIPLV